jgi:prenyltransferase beta subunit
MRLSFVLAVLLPSLAHAQTEEVTKALDKKLDNDRTAKWVLEQEAPDGGFYATPQDPKSDAKPQASLRATNAAVKALKYLGFPMLPKQREKHAAFVLKCHDPKTGGFAEPGGKPDVTTTAIGVMAAAELEVPHEKYAKAMDYLKENAKTFEEVRIGAAAVEAWGVKECPFKLDEWFEIAARFKARQITDGDARDVGSYAALMLRLGRECAGCEVLLLKGQCDDGGWGEKGAKASDIGSTYRVMRAMYLMKAKPKDVKKLRAFIAARRNKDGGYATEPGGKSTVNGVYYAAIITHWLDELEKK